MDKGFTLIEVIIVVCIFLLLFAIIWPISAGYYRQELLNKANQQVVWILKQARTNAVNQKNNSSFGVRLQSGQAILFQGDNFENRSQSEDISYTLPGVVSISGADQIIFDANTGFVSFPGSVILSSSGSSKEIKINKLGVLNY